MNRTKIEWVKNPDGSQGYTWNPITGCLNHVDGICKGGGFPCYAYKLAKGRLKNRYLHGRGWKINYDPAKQGYTEACLDPFYPRFWPSRLLELRGTGDYDNAYPDRNAYHASREKEKGIFVCDMSDLFGIGIPEDWTRQVLRQCKEFFQHRFYLLTKQPQNLVKFSPFPDNCWVGVTITNRYQAHNASHYLPLIESKIKFISYEPLLDEVTQALYNFNNIYFNSQWLIIGAQTKPYKPPRVEWVRDIVEAGYKAGVPVFLKYNLMPIFKGRLFADEIWAFNENIIENQVTGEQQVNWGLRQEMPNA